MSETQKSDRREEGRDPSGRLQKDSLDFVPRESGDVRGGGVEDDTDVSSWKG